MSTSWSMFEHAPPGLAVAGVIHLQFGRTATFFACHWASLARLQLAMHLVEERYRMPNLELTGPIGRVPARRAMDWPGGRWC